MSDEQALLAEVYRRPGEDEPRAVYADFLTDKGNKVGELIHLQLARAKGKKGTKAKEKRAFDAQGWPDHPVSQICGGVGLDKLDRGFPAVFSPSMPVTPGSAKEVVESWRKHIGHPGWASLTEVSIFGVDRPIVAELLDCTAMPLLRKVATIGPNTLFALKGPLRATELGVMVEGDYEMPNVSAFPHLTHLSWYNEEQEGPLRSPTTAIETTLRQIREVGFLEQVTDLDLQGQRIDSLLFDALRVWPSLPSNIRRFRLCGSDVNYAELTRDNDLVLHLNAHVVEEVAADLRDLQPDAAPKLTVEFDNKGYFTKRSRPRLQQLIRDATAQLPQCELKLE